ncbi:hypothetical protein ABIB57_002988 [Devosia sp. UYZn731]|uniref:molybdopterin-dependent oxidoreductase n=1 Tax=Devosia sp. UYZn731 TaxID=3156345 RepID=UPI00339692C7
MFRLTLSLAFAVLLSTTAFAAPAQLTGAVTTPLTLDEVTLKALPATTLDVSFQTSKGPETGHYTGALLWDLVNKAVLVNDEGKNAALKHTLLITGSDGYAVSVALGELDPNFANTQVLLAYDGADGKAAFDHLRLVVPGDVHGGRSVKDVVGIEVK